MENEPMNLDVTCRICLSSKEEVRSLHQASDGESTQSYSSLLMQCFKVDVTPEESLPNLICVPCIQQLMAVNTFWLKLQESDQKLREIALKAKVCKEECLTYEIQLGDAAIVKEEPNDYEETFKYESDNEPLKYEIKESIQLLKHSKNGKKKRKDKFKTVLSLNDHKSSKKRRFNKIKEIFQCDYCMKYLNNRSTLILHIRTHTKERPFQCLSCDKSFAAKGTLRQHHFRVHSNAEKHLACCYCEKMFNNNTGLKIHLRIHTGEKPYACRYCPKHFSQVSTRIHHERAHTGHRPYPCHICDKAFLDKRALTRHLYVHTEEKNFSCHVCGKELKTSQSLTLHLKIHQQVKDKNICDQCGLNFSTQGNYKQHLMRMHSERSGQCEVCKHIVSNLEEHMKTTHKVQDTIFKCDYCDKKYTNKSRLRNHIYTLHVVPKYLCKVEDCRAGFPLQQSLDYHVLKYHSHTSPSYTCPDCSAGYLRVSDYTRHMRVKHNKRHALQQRKHNAS